MGGRLVKTADRPSGVPLTVLMGVFNTPVWMLEQAIGSILQQTYGDLEFLILDDGSTRAQTSCALELAARRDARIRLIQERHRGLTATLNRGLELARGPLIARQDADDWSEPTRFHRQTAYLDSHPEAVLLGSGAWMHQQDGTELWRIGMPQTHVEIAAALEQRNPFVHGAAMFRREAALHVGGYREELPCSQDYDFFWRLAETGGAANLPEPLYHYRYTAGSVSATRAAEQSRSHDAAQALARARRAGRSENVAAELAAAGGEGEFRARLKQADHLMLAGEYRQAARSYLDLARSRPASPLAWGKLARWMLFRNVPGSRRLCFR
jgi:glycosyltransferase involved in cell wall biosynthesis